MVIQEKASFNFDKKFESVSGVGDRDDNEVGGEQEEEGSPVLARCQRGGMEGNRLGNRRRSQG